LASELGVPIASTPHGVDWSSLVTLWQLAGQTLVVRLQTLAAWSDGPGGDVAAYDAAVDEYIGQIRRAWADTRHHWTAVTAMPTDFVEHVVTDPSDPPTTVMFTGFAGRAVSSDEVRFYLDAELSSFVDIRRDDVLHTQVLPPAQAPLGGQFVWARRNADLVRTLEEAAARTGSAAVLGAATAPWNGTPWSAAVPGNGDHGPGSVSGLVDGSPFGPVVDAPARTAFTDDEEEIPLPPGWPQAAR
jgi:hypothetical protein